MKNILIVGAGITGLMTALKLYKKYKITVIDAGPDPKEDNHKSGATYSGFDARHISFTETTPWTASNRHDLIVTSSQNNGWLCIPKGNLNSLEKEWIAAFQKTAKDNTSHDRNTGIVINLNKQGILEWRKLEEKYAFLKPAVDTTIMPIICRSKPDLLGEFNYEHSLDKRVTLYKNTLLPDSLSPFSKRQKELGDIGCFSLYGRAYYAKTLCVALIDFLQSQGVSFLWNHVVSEINSFENYQTAAVIWCSGVSHETAKILKDFNVLLGGVIGCWVEIDNPGITVPCKIYGPEPVNYINITPYKNNLLLSGGYGFVGTRSYDEASQLAEPIMKAMIDEIANWLPKSRIKRKAYCIRPATPTGVPTLETHYINKKLPIVFAVGHCAGGFTQAPVTAEMIEKQLDEIKAKGF